MDSRVVVAAAGLTVVVDLVFIARNATSPSGYAPPRTTMGQPDLQGMWQVLNTAAWNIQDHSEERYPGLPARFSVPAGQGVVEGNDIPYPSWAVPQRDENYKNRHTADPEAKCYLSGVPLVTYMPRPFQILQFQDRVVILYEHLHAVRWFDQAANFSSDAVHIVERFTLIDRNTMHYQVTIDDPNAYTRPWTMVFPLRRNTEHGFRLLEEACHEGERNTDPQIALGYKIYPGMKVVGR